MPRPLRTRVSVVYQSLKPPKMISLHATALMRGCKIAPARPPLRRLLHCAEPRPCVTLRNATPSHHTKEPIDGREPAGPGRPRARGDAARLGERPGDGGGGPREAGAAPQGIDRAHG